MKAVNRLKANGARQAFAGHSRNGNGRANAPNGKAARQGRSSEHDADDEAYKGSEPGQAQSRHGSRVLLDERPLVLLPSLAKAVSVDGAIVLQQLHYYVVNPKCGREHDGKRWIFNTYADWREHDFPFWPEITIRRIFGRLEERGLVISCQPETRADGAGNRRKYYRIDYDQLGKIVTVSPSHACAGDAIKLIGSDAIKRRASRSKRSFKYKNNDMRVRGADEAAGVSVSSLPLWVLKQKKKHARAQDHPKWKEFADWCHSEGGRPIEKGFWTWLAQQTGKWRAKVKTRKDELAQMPVWKLQRLREECVDEQNRIYRQVKDINHLWRFPKAKQKEINRRYQAYLPRRDELRSRRSEIEEVLKAKGG